MSASGCVAVKFNGLQLCNGIITKKEKISRRKRQENTVLSEGYLLIGRMYHG